ncbi:MAG TPA: ribose 5-phosphate isomerase B [Candidatus Limnocylindria bacterium]|nr:ribose 5-phosphate isomerase B [Candidatus Limnocylindria bacterium]
MRVAIGSDHAGFALKQRLKRELESLGHEVVDVGADSGTESVDYPDFCFPVGEQVARGDVDRGIVLGGSGIGEGIAANKVAGVRASVVTDDETARLTRLHNDSNVLALGGRTNPDHEAVARWLKVWLETPFEGGRHDARLQKIARYEQTHLARR